MDLVYVVVLFVLAMMDIAVLSVGSTLLSLFFGFFSLSIGGVALGYPNDIPFHPYMQIMLMMVGALTLLIAGARFKGWV